MPLIVYLKIIQRLSMSNASWTFQKSQNKKGKNTLNNAGAHRQHCIKNRQYSVVEITVQSDKSNVEILFGNHEHYVP